MKLFNFFRKESLEERMERKAKEVENKAIKQIFKNEENFKFAIASTMLKCKFELSDDEVRDFFIQTIVSKLCGKSFEITDRLLLSVYPLVDWQRKWLFDFIVARFIDKDQDNVSALLIELGKREQDANRNFTIVEMDGDIDAADVSFYKSKYVEVLNALQYVLKENRLDVEWLQLSYRDLSFQDFALLFRGHVISILIGIVTRSNGYVKVVVHKDRYRRQLTECKEFGLVPCILPYDFTRKKFLLPQLDLVDSKSDKPFNLLTLSAKEHSFWTIWDYYNFGLNFAVHYLKSKGFNIKHCCNTFGIDPAIIAEKDSQTYYFIVNTCNRYSPTAYGILYDQYSAYLSYKYIGMYMEIRVSERIPADRIKRGAPLEIEFMGMKPIEDAITSNQNTPSHIYLAW